MSSPPDTADAAGLHERLRETEERLAEKQRTVAELTGRLERMAEKLDRLHRMGLDRGMRVGGFPKEVIDQQSALVADLQQAVQAWQDVQTEAALGRIEIQLLELRDFVIDRVTEWEASQQVDDEEAQPKDGDAAAEVDAGENSAPSEPAGSEPEHSEPAPPPAPRVIERVDPPEVVDLPHATTAQLQRQSEQQDRFIDYLQSKLEVVNREYEETGGTMCWYGTSEEIDARLNQVTEQLEEAVQLADYELALQRRLLERKESALAERERLLLDRLRALGVPENPGGE